MRAGSHLWFALGNDHATQLIHYEEVEVTGSAAEKLLEKRKDCAHRFRGVLQRHGDVAQHDHDVLRHHFVFQFLVVLAEIDGNCNLSIYYLIKKI